MYQEDERLELKKSTNELKEAIISIVAILNKHGKGKTIFGIKDNGEIIGQQVTSQTIRNVSKLIAENIEPRIYPTVTKIELDDKNCILVEFEGEDVPYFAYGRALRAAIFATDTKTTFLDMKDFKGNIFNLIDYGEQYIAQNIRWSLNFNTGKFEREDIPEVPIRAMRETLCNSFCHRDWNEPYDNYLAIYKNRIEICNPGFFTDEATPEDYIYKEEPSRPRNPLIAQILYLSGEIEKRGSGIRNVYKTCKKDKIKVKFENRKTAFFVKKRFFSPFFGDQSAKNHPIIIIAFFILLITLFINLYCLSLLQF